MKRLHYCVLCSTKRNFVDVKTMSFLVKDKKLLVKSKRIWAKIKSIIGRKKFESDAVFDEKYLQTKIKSCSNKSTRIFTVKQPKKDSRGVARQQ